MIPRKVSQSVFVWLILAAHAWSQIITTVAGTDFVFPRQPLPAITAPLGPIRQVALDSKGNVYLADPDNNLVMRISPEGTASVVAGNGVPGSSGDGGPATAASLSSPSGIAVDSAGNLYIADSNNNRVRKVAGGTITTVAGNGNSSFSGDNGPATAATLRFPVAVALDSPGNLYIADLGNNLVRKVSGGVITTVAGTRIAGLSGDGGPATSAMLDNPVAVALDSVGTLYILNYRGGRVRKVVSGRITLVAGGGTSTQDGVSPTSAQLLNPGGLALDSADNLYIADANRIRKVSGGVITTVAGSLPQGFSGDGGPATQATLNYAAGVAVDSTGNLFIADSLNLRLRKVTASTGTISTIAGNGRFRFSGNNGPAVNAALNLPTGIAVDGANNFYISDTTNNRIRKITGGVISTVAGNGVYGGFEGNISFTGSALDASLATPLGIAVDSAGDLYIADFRNFGVRKLSNGTISTVAGGGNANPGDGGPATSARLITPRSVAVDASGTLYIVDSNDHRVSKVVNSTITTVAGTSTPGFSGDGGPASSAALNTPVALALDSAGNLYIADLGNNRVRKITGGIITTVAGNGVAGSTAGDGGPATNAALDMPSGIVLDAGGSLYIAERSRIRKVTGGTISAFAGGAASGFSGDGGPAINARFSFAGDFNYPTGMVFDAAGNLLIADTNNNRIRVILAKKPALSLAPVNLTFSGQSAGKASPMQTVQVTASVSGVLFSVAPDPNAKWLSASVLTGATPQLVEITANPLNLAPGTYNANITITAPDATPTTSTIAVTFVVTASVPPALSIDKANLSFPFPRNGTARSQGVTISNSGGGTLNFTATASTNSGGNWLSVVPTSGTALPGAPATLAITADPKGLGPQTYTGQIAIVTPAGNATIPVTMTISTLDQAILLSQSGLSFTAISQGGIVPPQTFAVRNIGTGVIPWTVKTSTLSGGNWLFATPSSGTSDASPATNAPAVEVSVKAASLLPGKYYGLVQVDAPNAANSPQVLTVFLQVLPAGSDRGALAQPSELIFTTTAGASAPSSQNVFLYNVTSTGKSFRSKLTTDTGLNIVTLPTNATLDPQVPGQIVVQPFTQGLASGVYNAILTLQFDDGRLIAVRVQIVVAKTDGSSSAGRAAEGCTPTKLLPTIATLPQQFQVPAGPPIALITDIFDDCKNPHTSGAVTVTFSNGDDSINLQPVGGGRWEATWKNSRASSQLTLTVSASNPALQISGSRQVSGAAIDEPDPPLLDRSGVVSSATAVSFAPLAPGGLISLYGSRLADTAQSFTTTPLPKRLGNAVVTMAGQVLPLLYAGPNQINAIVPAGININTTHQVYVIRGLTQSVPVPVDVGPAQPSLFAYDSGVAIAQAYRGNDPPFLVSTQAPATAGDVVVLYCAGLGETNPKVADGTASPFANTVNSVSATIGGQNAPVQFAGLTPGFVGLYQVNIAVPAGVVPGSASVTLNVAGQSSPGVSLPVR